MGDAPLFTVGWVFNLEVIPDHSHAQRDIALLCLLSSLTFVSICVRFATRWHKLKTLGIDDYFALFGGTLGCCYAGTTIYQTRWGLGLPEYAFPAVNTPTFTKIQYAGGPLYYLAVLGFKGALLGSYMRIAGFKSAWRRVLQVAFALVIFNQVSSAIIISIPCLPVRAMWDTSVDSTCMDIIAADYATAVLSLIFDVMCIILPFPLLRTLNLPKKKKVGIGIMLALGFLATGLCIARCIQISKLEVYSNSEILILLSAAEIHVGLIVCCIPGYLPIVKFLSSKISTSVTSRGSKNHSKGPSGNMGGYGNPKSHLETIGSKSNATHHLKGQASEDEIALWDSRKGYIGPEKSHGFYEANIYPLDEFTAQGQAHSDAESDSQRRQEAMNDIHVVRQVSVSSGKQRL